VGEVSPSLHFVPLPPPGCGRVPILASLIHPLGAPADIYIKKTKKAVVIASVAKQSHLSPHFIDRLGWSFLVENHLLGRGLFYHEKQGIYRIEVEWKRGIGAIP
jgi:hypothetical protein